MLDILLKNGKIVDGTGNPWFYGDVGVKDGIIAGVGRIEISAEKEIDVDGSVISPGFIDMHGHADLYILKDPFNTPKVLQGVTTDVLGNCGLSCAPVRDEDKAILRRYDSGVLGDFGIEWDWNTLGEYLKRVGKKLGINVVAQVPHSPVRLYVMGMEKRAARSSEIEEMADLVREGMREGARGFSTGLEYVPLGSAETEELIELARAAGEYGGFFSIHGRDLSTRYIESINEAFEVAEKAGVRLQFSHLGVRSPYWDRMDHLLSLFDMAREKGIDAAYDIETYTYGGTTMTYLLPDWVMEEDVSRVLEKLGDSEVRARILEDILKGGKLPFDGWNVLWVNRAPSEENKWMAGKSIEEISRDSGKEPIDVICDVLIDEVLDVTMMHAWEKDEHMIKKLGHHLWCVGSDAIQTGGVMPGTYGTFPRLLGYYVREKKATRLEIAVQRMTSFPASRLGLSDRGLIRVGLAADLTVFDPLRVKDNVTFTDATYPDGIPYVLVNGKVAVEDGEVAGEYGGRVL